MSRTNTFKEWAPQFADLGIPEGLLLQAVSYIPIADRNYQSWHRACNRYICNKLFTEENRIITPRISDHWRLLLLSHNINAAQEAVLQIKEEQAIDCYGVHYLDYIILSGAIDIIKFYGEGEPDLIRVQDSHKATAAHYAALLEDCEALKYVIEEHGVDPMQQDHFGRTALHFSASSDSLETLKYLIEVKQMNPVEKDKGGLMPLHYAAWAGNKKAFAYLVEKAGMNVKERCNNGVNSLHYAAFSKSREMLEHIICDDPYASVDLWVKDRKGRFPDGYSVQNGCEFTASQVLQDILKNAIINVCDRAPNRFAKACDILKAYQKKLVAFIAQWDAFDDDTLGKMLDSKYIPYILDPLIYKQLKAVVALNEKRKALQGQLITMYALSEIILTALKCTPCAATSLYSKVVSPLQRELQCFLKKIPDSSEKRGLTGDEILVLVTIFDDYRKQSAEVVTRDVDHAVMHAIEGSTQFQLLRPQAKIAVGRNIVPDNFSDHLDTCRNDLGNLTTLSDDTVRLMHQVLDGINHIINNKGKIVAHARDHYSELYFLVGEDKLPLHTDHNGVQEPDAYYETLQRLVTEFFAIFYLSKEMGRLNAFCDSVSTGYCFEDRIVGLTQWALQLSEMKFFTELMQDYLKSYKAYQRVMHTRDEVESGTVKRACDFIYKRHKDIGCKVDPDYAPEGKVTRKGVAQYLEKICAYGRRNVSLPSMLRR